MVRNDRPAVSGQRLRDAAARHLGSTDRDETLAGPMSADLSGLPPLLVQTETADVAVDEVRRLVARAREHGVEVDLQTFPVRTHVFHLFWSFLPEAAEALDRAGRFARSVPRGHPTAAAVE